MNHGMTLQGGEWIVRAIGSAPASDSARATMRFGEDGRITGNTTCNSYSASYTTARLQITIMQVASTKRACVAERLMEQERRFLDLLQRATTWKIHGDSTLTLAAPTGEAITAKR
jgi:putative lipoprotein